MEKRVYPDLQEVRTPIINSDNLAGMNPAAYIELNAQRLFLPVSETTATVEACPRSEGIPVFWCVMLILLLSVLAYNMGKNSKKTTASGSSTASSTNSPASSSSSSTGSGNP